MLISELCKDYFWIMPKTPKYVDGANIPYITSKNLNNGTINYKDCKYITEDAFKNLTSKRFIQEDDFLISMIGTVGEVGIVKKADLPIYGQNMYLLRPNYELVNKRYLYNFITSTPVNTKLQNIINGATQGYLHDKDIINLFLVDRTLDEQAKIATQLDRIRNIIELKRQELNNFDELIKSRFIEMFMDKSNNDIYPLRQWKDVVIVKHGKDYKNNIVRTGGYPVYGSGGFMGIYADNYLVNENSVIIGRKGTIDNPIFVKEKFWNVDTAFGIEVDSNVLNPIYFYIRSTMYDLKSMSTSTTLPSMTKDTLHRIWIGIPPIELQNKFAEFYKLIDKSKFIVQQQIKDLQELLDKKMDEYFGE